MTEISFNELVVIACVAATIVGFFKVSLAGGAGLVLATTLTVFIPARVVLGLAAPMLSFADPIALRCYWRQWDRRQLVLLVPPTCAGVALGVWGLAALSDFWLTKTIGALALGFAVLQLLLRTGDRLLVSAHPHWATGAVAGLVTGVASAIAHLGSSVLSLYMMSLRLSNAAFVATVTLTFTLVNVFKVWAYWQVGIVTPGILGAAVLSLPFLVAGGLLGYRLNRVLPRRWFELLLIGIAIAGSLDLLLRR